ncbi:KAP family P-loop NTPase fold protein [Roseibium aggregatum]|uniref:KAP NTPase domain-containing protein n=1 Tax=Roseibium aggregatum TaxID=187304 RepID=A0A926NWU3_9HYPH|nr:P-loop NTPase fold protein [Roseibium aggregatum]MBD1545120.1 hypothetical protein [Roseibium aggregatum]
MPDDLIKYWQELKAKLGILDEGWDVWTEWYEDRLAGKAPEDEALAVAGATLPEPIWHQGPKLVNATIKELTELYNKGGPEMLEARMAELREQYPEEAAPPEGDVLPEAGSSVSSVSGDSQARPSVAEQVRQVAENMKVEDLDIPALDDLAKSPEATESGTDQAPADDANDEPESPSLPKVWILQYTPNDRVARWTAEAVPGSTLRWKSGKALPKAMKAGDPVVYWRAIDPENRDDRGGLVGLGQVISTETEDEDGTLRFPTRVRQFDDDNPLPRDQVINEAGITRRNWRGAVLSLKPEEVARLRDFLQDQGWPELSENQGSDPSVAESEPPAEEKTEPLPEGEIRVRRDDAERDHDALGRGALAVSLATILHEIWCIEQGLKPYKARAPQKDAAGFVAHIDAPWGGGKTSFANLIARTLNPELDGPGTKPDFLETLYPDRKDMTGLFLSGDKVDPQQPGTLESRYDREARRPWIIVPFNAWLNQHVDPPWWSFYQTIRKACFSTIWTEGCPDIVFNGDGPYEMKRESRFHRFDRWRGLWVRELLWRFWTPKVQNAFITFGFVILAFVLLLGLGLFDLKVLTSFFKDGKLPEGTSALGGAAKFLITFLTILMGGASAAWSLFATFTQTLLPGTPEAAKNYSLGSADPLSRFRKHFAEIMEAVERPVLVIIDDIDRCEPKFIVEMTRGLQTILKSPRVVYLLLGDRNWIEQAFEVCHSDMKHINVGPEHTFGGRFVEKAIQLSYVLPDMGEKLEDYVSTVLIGRVVQQQEADAAEEPQPEDGSDTASSTNAPGDQGKSEQKESREPTRAEPEIDPELLRSITDTISKGHTLEDIDRLASATIENIRQSAPRANRKVAERAVRDAVILQRSTRREAVEEAIRHRLQPIGHFLPGNPRHIKRIINAISMYQNSLVAFEAQQEDRKVGGKRWRQLVVGVVLMIGYPKSWGILAKNPEWAEYLLAEETKLPGSEGTGGPADEAYASLVRNTVFATLMKDAKLTDENGAPVTTEIDKDAVEWLNKIVPVAGG